MSTDDEVKTSRAIETEHSVIGAHLKAGLWLVAACGELAVCDGHAYELQTEILTTAEKARKIALAMTELHVDLAGWEDALDDLGRDLEKFRAALVEPAQDPDDPDR